MNKFYENAQNMSKFLTKTEERISSKELLEKLIDAASLDPENMKVGAVQVPGEEYKRPVVLGEHAISRGSKRLGLDTGDVLRMAINALKNPLVSNEVVEHIVVWDNTQNSVVAYEEDGITHTVLVDDMSRYTLIFEAGFEYILLKTVWDNCFGELRTNNTDMVVRINKNGAMTRKVGGWAA